MDETASNRQSASKGAKAGPQKKPRKASKPGKTKTSAKTTGQSLKSQKRGKGSVIDLPEVFRRELSEAREGEAQTLKLLPLVAQGAHTPQLREVLDDIARDSEAHLRKIDRVIEAHGKVKQSGKKPQAMAGLIAAAHEKLRLGAPSPARDMLLITALQKICHIGIASYGSLRAWSRIVDDRDAVQLLKRITKEKIVADDELTRVSEDYIAETAAEDSRSQQGSDAATRDRDNAPTDDNGWRSDRSSSSRRADRSGGKSRLSGNLD